MSDADPRGARAPMLLVLESYPPGLPPTGEALPPGSPWFERAAERWAIEPALLGAAVRVNALAAPPRGRRWYPEARQRVRDALRRHRPRVAVASGWVARSALRGVLSFRGDLEWAKPVVAPAPAAMGFGDGLLVLSVPHFSGRCRLLNAPAMRDATSAAWAEAFRIAFAPGATGSAHKHD